jgi:uncharacterized protein
VTTEVVVKNAMARIRPVLSASCVALSVGWAAAAMAGPVEDLLNAAYRGDMAAVQALLNTGTDVNARTSEICRGSFTPACGGATALIMASFTGHLDIVQALLAKGADVNAKMDDGATALGMATLAGSPLLLALGVAPAPDSCRPPSCPIVEIVQALLARGADVNAKDKGGGTVLMAASATGHLDIVQALLDKGADVNAKGNLGTALIGASAAGHLDVMQTLLDKGADVNAKGALGTTALMGASFAGHLDIVQALLARGADVNAPMNNGNNALMGASRAGRVDVVRALLAKGADVNARTNNGMTALTVARNAAVEALLVQAGAKP